MSTEQKKPADYTMRDGTPWWKFETMMPPSMDAPILLMNHESGAITPHKDGRYLYDEKDLWTPMPPEAPKATPSLPASPELPESVRQAIPAIAERAFKAHKQSVGDHWAHEDAICENQAEDFAMQVACELLPLWRKAEGGVPDATTYTKSYSGKGYFEDNPLAYITIMVGHRELVRVPSSLLKELLRDFVEVDGWPTPTPSPVAGLPTPETDAVAGDPVLVLATARSLERRLAAASAQASDYCQRWIDDGKTTDALRAQLATAKEELAHVLSDWNELVKASGSPTNGGAVAHVHSLRSDLAKANAAVEKAQEQIAHDLARENTLLAEIADLRGSINVKDRCNLELSEQVRGQEGQITSLRFSLAAANAAVEEEAKGKLGGAILFGQLGGRLITRIMEAADMSLPDATDVELQLVRMLSELASLRAQLAAQQKGEQP